MKDGKTGKSRSKKKVVSFSSASLFPTRKREAVTQRGNQGDRPSDAEDDPGNRYRQRLGEQERLQVYFRYFPLNKNKKRSN